MLNVKSIFISVKLRYKLFHKFRIDNSENRNIVIILLKDFTTNFYSSVSRNNDVYVNDNHRFLIKK